MVSLIQTRNQPDGIGHTPAVGGDSRFADPETGVDITAWPIRHILLLKTAGIRVG